MNQENSRITGGRPNVVLPGTVYGGEAFGKVPPGRPNRPVETSTSYEATLKEALDGDTAEAFAVVNGGRRTGERGDLPARPQQDDVRPSPARSVRLGETGQKNGPGNAYVDLQGQRNSQPRATKGSAQPDVRSAPFVQASHDQLMLAASRMRFSEAATHISFKTFQTLKGILSKQHWTRAVDVGDRLMRAQMASVERRPL